MQGAQKSIPSAGVLFMYVEPDNLKRNHRYRPPGRALEGPMGGTRRIKRIKEILPIFLLGVNQMYRIGLERDCPDGLMADGPFSAVW